ncbi:MAG: membrane protein insertase YidC [Clostridia bacterium]|nr:membrane protein insertase YidC [Clostridia bacterium]
MQILYYPFGWALGALYSLTHNYLVALIILTVVLRLLLLPSSIKQQKSSANQMRLTAKVNKIKRKYVGQNTQEARQKQQQEIQELYSREGFRGMGGGCAPMALQLVVMMGLYGAIYQPLQFVLGISAEKITTLIESLKAFLGEGATVSTRPQLEILRHIENLANTGLSDAEFAKVLDFKNSFTAFGFDLTNVPKDDMKTVGWYLILIPVLAGLTAMLSAVYTMLRQKKTQPDMGQNKMMMGCMMLLTPLMSGYFSYILPLGIGFYWIFSNILSFIQMIVMNIFFKPSQLVAAQMIDETVQRRAREKSIKETKALMDAQQGK